MANYNLPGVYTVYNERGLMMAPAAAAVQTDSILFIGAATDGPKFEPVKVERPQEAISTFGSCDEYITSQEDAPKMLVQAFKEAYYAGARDIYLMRINGKEAELVLSDDEAESKEAIRLFGKYPGKKYNDIKVTVINGLEGEKLLQIPAFGAKVDDEPVEFKYDSYDSIESLVFDINLFANLTGVRAEVVDPLANFKNLAAVDGVPLTDGDDDLGVLGEYSTVDESGQDISGTGYRGMLEEAYELMTEYSANIVIPLGVYVGYTEDATPIFDKQDAQKLADFCYEAARRNNDVIGIINTARFKDYSLSGVRKEVKRLATVDNTYVSENGEDIGKYINVVVGEGRFKDKDRTYTNVLSPVYGALVSTLPVQSGSTNKTIDGENIVGLLYSLAPAQSEMLTNNKFTVIRNKYGRGITVVEGVTASKRTSDFQSLSSVRIIHGVMDAIRNTVDPFIGESLSIPNVASLENAIRGTLSKFMDRGAISGANFELLFPRNIAIFGDVDVQLELEIASELRRVLVTVSRRFPEY